MNHNTIFDLIPLVPRDKKPRDVGWNLPDYLPGNVSPNARGTRVGIKVADVDCDAPEAVAAAPDLLPPTNCTHGRASKPSSHYWYRTPEPISTKQYRDVDGAMLVELRGLDADGRPLQTAIPDSVHPSGEQLMWFGTGEPAQISCGALEQAVRTLAIEALVVRHWPASGRHHTRLALAGLLFRAGLDLQTVQRIGTQVMRATNSDEHDWLQVVRSTAEKHGRGEKLTGGPSLASLLSGDGQAVVRRLNSWLGRDEIGQHEALLDDLNDRYALISRGPKVVVVEFDREGRLETFWPIEEFRKRLIKRTVPLAKGRPQGLADWWIKHPQGREYGRLIYAPPGSPELKHLRLDDFNGWRGFNVQPAHGDWSRNREHLHAIICGGDDALFRWTMNWLAALAQRPGAHAHTALVLRGEQGVGKGHFADVMVGSVFDRQHYVLLSGRDKLVGSFNGLLSGKVLVFADEMTWGGDPTMRATLKSLITNDQIQINEKYLPCVTERSMIHLIIASNEEWPVAIDGDDRRFTVYEVRQEHKQDIAYFAELHDELEKGGRAALLHDLLAWRIDDVALRRPHETASKRAIKEVSFSPEERWMQDFLMDDDGTWRATLPRGAVFEAYKRSLPSTARGVVKATFGKFLKRIFRAGGVKGDWPRQVQGKGGNSWGFPPLADCRRAFDRATGTQTEWPPINEEHPLLTRGAADSTEDHEDAA